MSIARYFGDTNTLEKEHDSYVPEHDQENNVTDPNYHHDVNDENGRETPGTIGSPMIHTRANFSYRSATTNITDVTETNVEPQTFPLQALGVVDINGDEITASDLMAHAMSNSSQTMSSAYDKSFTIRRGSTFVNKYARTDPVTGERTDGGPSNPNHLLGTFLTLFPYGKGGFETKRAVDVPYELHARWALQYHNKRFRKDLQFPFQVFSVCQKREVCRSTVLQMKKTQFSRNMDMISTIRPEDLIKASSEETRKIRFTNPAIRAPRRNLTAVRTTIKGSDESRFQVRSKVWGMTLMFNPPSLWITINPLDTQDPIAQVLAGIDIDLDNFCDTAGPNATERATNVANDPFASAKFFHLMICTVIRVLFGFKRSQRGYIERRQGILGIVQGYVGTVEAQGRGTLHFHMLIWLKDAPTSHEMQRLLSQMLFRNKVAEYISRVVKADVDGKTSEEILAIPPIPSITYSRPPNPRAATTEPQKVMDINLARTLQFHTCTTRTCLKYIRGRFACKRCAPFPTASADWINKHGEWGPKRTCAYLNSWNPWILQCIRSNNDIKLITNGRLTAKLTFYITSYTTKKQQMSSNVSALLAKDLAFHKKIEKKNTDIKNINRCLIQRCANSLTKHREFSVPEVISYVMGWKDTFESHHFTALYLDAIVQALKKEFPSLIDQRTHEIEARSYREPTNTIQVSQTSVTIKDQLKDYELRGVGLTSMNLFDFIISTYEGEIIDNLEPLQTENRPRRPGRPQSERHPYLPAANKGKLCRIIKNAGHGTVPRIVGSWFPRSDKESKREMHRAVMIALFVPWRSLSDIKIDTRCFKDAYIAKLPTLTAAQRDFIDNAQYYHECLDGTRDEKYTSKSQPGEALHFDGDGTINDQGAPNDNIVYSADKEVQDITEEDIELAKTTRSKPNKRLYGKAAIDSAIEHGIFSQTIGTIVGGNVAQAASPQDLDMITNWETQLQSYNKSHKRGQENNDPKTMGQASGLTTAPNQRSKDIGSTSILSGSPQNTSNNTRSIRPKLNMLNNDQRRAHDIIEDRLQQYTGMSGWAEQLRMLVLGPGGTGKSLLIGAITETFVYYSQEHILVKCATTGIAATNIGGQTLHSWAVLPVALPKDDTWLLQLSKDVMSQRKKNVEGKVFLIIDKVSMEDKAILYDGSLAVGKI